MKGETGLAGPKWISTGVREGKVVYGKRCEKKGNYGLNDRSEESENVPNYVQPPAPQARERTCGEVEFAGVRKGGGNQRPHEALGESF